MSQICTSGHEYIGSVCDRCGGIAQSVNSTVPTEMITPEMREAGIDESTPMVSREEVVAELGEDAVAKIEKEALAVKPIKKSKKK